MDPALYPNPHVSRHDRRQNPGKDVPDIVATLTAAVPAALARGDIDVHFQPQVRIADDRITGVEALARWDHPLFGPVEPDLLFEAADCAGLARALSSHVQQRALDAASAWPAQLERIDLSLNVTAGDLAEPDFARTLLARIGASGLKPGRVSVEVTETAPIADLDAAALALGTLRDAGVRIALDDVGAGHAGFAYLKVLPLDRLKIDKSVAAAAAQGGKALALTRGIIALAGALDLDVVAEGVESERQRAILAGENCGWYQGFLCAGALDSVSLAKLVQRRA